MAKRKRRGRGEGSIYRRADGLWVASVVVGHKADGKPVRRPVYGRTKAIAQEKLRKLLAGETPVPTARATLAAYLPAWLEAARPALEETSYADYERAVRLVLVPRLGHVELAKLTAAHVRQLYADMAAAGDSPAKRAYAGTILGAALKHAVSPLGLVKANPVSQVPKPRVPKRRMATWTAPQVETFWREARLHRLYALFVLASLCGLRVGELAALDWPDLDLEAGSLSVQRTLQDLQGRLTLKEPKTAGSRRRVELPRVAVEVLRTHRERMRAEGRDVKSGPVFTSPRGYRLRRSHVRARVFLPILARTGLPVIRVHDLRHTAATLLLSLGVHPKVVQEMLGHANISTTLGTYSHVMPGLQRDAADRLDGLFGGKKPS